jgi:hypothetical protein
LISVDHKARTHKGMFDNDQDQAVIASEAKQSPARHCPVVWSVSVREIAASDFVLLAMTRRDTP